MSDFSEYVSKAARAAGYDIDSPRGGGRTAIAEATGMALSSVGRVLAGQTMPTARYMTLLAVALDVPLDSLLDAAGFTEQAPEAGTGPNSGLAVNGQLIRRKRAELGHGMNHFAALIGLSGAALSRIENGGRNPRPETLKKIAEALGCEIADIAYQADDNQRMTESSAGIVAKIRMLRQIQKISAQTLADRVTDLGFPISRSVLANIESGRVNTVSVDFLLFTAKALGTDAVTVLSGPVECPTCHGNPPEGFTCNTCGGA